MKRLLTGALALLLSLAASATTLNPIQLLNPAGSSSGQAIVSTGASSSPAWGGVGLNGIAAIAANTVLANGTGSSASPTAYAMPSCSGTASALTWLSSTGFGCNTLTVTYATLASPTFTGVPAAPTAAATTNTTQIATTAMVNSAITGNALAGSFTTLASSGAYTPSQTAGIVGTTTNNNANAGSVGEYVTNSTSGTSLTSNTSANCTSASLTAGDWDVSGSIQFVPAGSTTVSGIDTGISTTSATLGALGSLSTLAANLTTGISQYLPSPMVRVSLSGTTTVYVIGNASFGVSTMTCNGFIRARRVR